MVDQITHNDNLSINIQSYFTLLSKQLNKVYNIAAKARKKGLDPTTEVEIPIAKDIADRVEGLIGPEGVGKKIREYERKNLSREQVAFKIAEDICKEKLLKGSKEKLAEQAIRSSLAVITESITAAPIEGIAKIEIKSNFDGTEYLAIYYAGPIRSAGGTAAGMSVLLADYIRKNLNLAKYQPDQREIERYVEELELYNRVSHLQLPTSKDEQRFAAENLPIEITGEPTDKVEVSGNRDLKRINTNKLRGGACLVFNDGLVGRSKKIFRRVKENHLEGWDWLEELIKIHEMAGHAINEDEIQEHFIDEDDLEVLSDEGYIKDVIAGRPVFAHPSEIGGFRIRYGRARTTGLAGMGIHPALMGVTDDFLACGTHVRTERPGKGAIVMPVNTIHPPVVKLKNGDVIKVTSYKEAKSLQNNISEILFLGDMLYGVGEFNQNSYDLIPAGYCEEWWSQELEEQYAEITAKEKDLLSKNLVSKIKEFINNPNSTPPSPSEAIAISEIFKIPLHPEYTFHWTNITVEDYIHLRNYIANYSSKQSTELEIPFDNKIKEILEWIFVPHKFEDNKINFGIYSSSMLISLGIHNGKLKPISNDFDKILDLINDTSSIEIRNKCQSYTGARMGRPEKAKDRRMKPPVHLLFPIENEGGRLRDLYKASENKTINIDITDRYCPTCGESTHKPLCSSCGSPTVFNHRCKICNMKLEGDICPKCNRESTPSRTTDYPIGTRVKEALKSIGGMPPKNVKAVKKLMNRHKAPELIEKGILRAKHGVFVYRDGTTRFDSTDAVLTHFKPSEIGISIQQLHKIGYMTDVDGKPLEEDNQLVELKIQDVVVNKEGGKHLLKVAKFLDELLEKAYALPPYYKAKKPEDLIGQIIIGLAPHTSAGITGRIIGFTEGKVNFAHPYWHAAKRRNCFPGDTKILVEINGSTNKIPIRQLYEEFYENEFSDKQVFVKDKPKGDIKVYSFNKNNPGVSLTEIVDVIKAPSTDHLIRFNLVTGRSFETTPHHPVSIFSDGKIIEKRALEVEKNDLFVLPTIITEPYDIDEFDLLEEFSQIQFKSIWNKLMIRGIKSFTKKLVDKKGLFKTADGMNINRKTLNNYYGKRDSIPFSVLIKLLTMNNLTIEDVPSCYLGFKRDHTYVNRKIKVNNSFMKLLGYYLSEGYYSKGDRAFQVDFAVSEVDLRKDMLNAVTSTFGSGFKPYIGDTRITISNRVIYLFFKDILKLENFSRKKRVPSIFLKFPQNKLKHLLAAYFSGDGGVDRNHKVVSCSSFSEDLINDIDLLLLQFGIFSAISKHKRESNTEFKLRIRGDNVFKFSDEIGFTSLRKSELLRKILKDKKTISQKMYKNHRLLRIRSIEYIKSNERYVYSLNAKDYHTVLINENIVTHQCDGDEDSIILALDAFLNFSRYYLPEIRGGKMDAPLILVANLNPHEVDDESHNVDTCNKYPLKFYESTLNRSSPKSVLPLIDMISNRLDNQTAYEGFYYSHETSSIFDGPESTAYKNLETMEDKVEAQLKVASLVKSVDVKDVATRIIVNHFIPDLIGNMRRFGSQKFRCTKCNRTYRRIPLSEVCPNCKMPNLNLTVHEKSVTKYLNMAQNLVERYELSEYLRNRLDLIRHNAETLFENGAQPTQKKQTSRRKQTSKITEGMVKLSDFFVKSNDNNGEDST